jgi:hypothetical protein
LGRPDAAAACLRVRLVGRDICGGVLISLSLKGMLVGTGAGAGAGARFEELFSFRGVLEKQSCSLVFEGSLVDTGVEGTGLCGFRAIVGKVLMSLF